MDDGGGGGCFRREGGPINLRGLNLETCKLTATGPTLPFVTPVAVFLF